MRSGAVTSVSEEHLTTQKGVFTHGGIRYGTPTTDCLLTSCRSASFGTSRARMAQTRRKRKCNPFALVISLTPGSFGTRLKKFPVKTQSVYKPLKLRERSFSSFASIIRSSASRAYPVPEPRFFAVKGA